MVTSPAALTAAELELREQVRKFLAETLPWGTFEPGLGMSEPDAGSDLASVRTKGVRDTDGWRVSGVKVWTSNAMRADFMIALCRTGDGERHAELSRFLIDMRSPGVTVKPIPFLNGSTDHFAEVLLDDVLVSDEMVIGDIGQGWAQNASELAFERSGPDRWISTFLLVQEFIRECPELAAGLEGSRLIGELAAQYWVLRRLSLTVARAIDAGGTPAAEAALIKEMGTRFEQDVVRALRELLDRELVCGLEQAPSLFERLLRRATLDAPSFTIRGGTTEVLRSVAAKGLS